MPRSASAMQYARSIVRQVCAIAGQPDWIDDLRITAESNGLVAAVASHDTAVIFDWLMWELSFQGISDAVAAGYIDRHGNVTWTEVADALAAHPGCGKLHGYWAFTGCGYRKGQQTCATPDQFAACPLPRHRLRNGRLNQTAYSLFLFIRDVADGDIVRWIDRQVTAHSADVAAARAALVGPLQSVYGISDKAVGMALAGLLIGAGSTRPDWFAVGATIVVVDTLVHNFLHRTGILHRLEATHPYGSGCYAPGGCADVLFAIAGGIDARQINPAFPNVFPRFVQHSIWRYCAQACFDICNGNQIDDRARCSNTACDLYSRCDRCVLRHVTAEKPSESSILSNS